MSTTVAIQRTSIERLELTITSDESLAGTTVEFQFKPKGVQPDPGDWELGQISSESAEHGSDRWLTQVETPVIGPGNLVVPPGHWAVWVRITTGSEQPIITAGYLVVL